MREIQWSGDIFDINPRETWPVGVRVGESNGPTIRIKFDYERGDLNFNKEVYEIRVRERRGSARTGANAERPIKIVLDDFSLAYELPVTTEDTIVTYRLMRGGRDVLIAFEKPVVTVDRNLVDFEEEEDYEYELKVATNKNPGVVRDTAILKVIIENLDEPLVVTGGKDFSYPENSTAVIETYTGTDPENNLVLWGVVGRDSDLFEISSDGEFTFKSPPDYETPLDHDTNNTYLVTVYGSDGRYIRRVPTRVRVVEVDEAPGLDVADAEVDENIASYFAVGMASDEPFPVRSLPTIVLAGNDGALFSHRFRLATMKS